MTSPKEPSNPLALAVLVLLFERPMHPYEMAATLKARRKELSIKLKYGSLYTVVDQLQKEGLIIPRETVREGRRPVRTIYGLTSAGETRMREWLRDLLLVPVKEYPKFEAALCLMPALSPAEALTLLEERSIRLGHLLEEMRAAQEIALQMGVEELFLVENQYRMEMIRAEQEFISELTRRIKDDPDYTRKWTALHASKS